MPNTAINIQDLSKRYSLKASSRFDRSLATFATKLVTGQLNSSNPKDANNDFLWALKDINLNIQKGEVHGIIGPNGSGKSTLLKLIARVIPPTTGTIQIAGRVGSMLELGIGFHPDLTGRENVYFAGALLGVPKRTIRAKIDEIIDYSGIPDFIDIPVNKYSSGMRVRLGFSLMTIIQPEILLIDEVLGVGDAEFQEKSRDRIKSMVHSGNAVLVVSHNSHVMADMCDRITRLELGAIIDQGDPSAVTKKYLADTLKAQTT